ncbi:MAG: ArsA family ATPase [Syntrophobacterales bacterium]|nr:ArsA family ATPase [Syntrophobacterales bacterium]
MRILFYTGKGGVGKSTMAASAAWQLSKKSRVLIVSLDPAHNLGDIFCVSLDGREKRMSETLVLREVDLHRLSRDYLEREIGILTRTYSYLQTLNLDRYFSVLKYSPGIEEYALLTSIEETIRKDGADFDTIIFDTPPTGLTLRFLALPQITITWIDRLVQIRRQILDKRHTIQKIRGTATEEEKKQEIRLAYDEKDDAVLGRLEALKANYGALTAVLQGPDCGVVLVFNPDMLSLRESERLVEGLRDINLPLRLLIQNKVTAENLAVADRVAAELRRMVKDVPLMRVALSANLACGLDSKLYEIPEDLVTPLDWRS